MYVRLIILLISLLLVATQPAMAQETPLTTVPKPQKKKATSLSIKTSLAENERGVQAILNKNWAEAENAFQRALLSDAGNLTAVFNLSGVYLTNKKNNLAITLLKEYTVRFKKDPGLFVRLGDAYFSSKDIKAATQSYEKAFALAPQYQELASKLATLYGLNQDFVRAERMLELAATQSPNDPQLLNNLGNLYILNGKADKAIEAAKQALQMRASKESYLTLGSAYEAQRDFKSSVIAYQKALDLGENRPEIAEKLEKLKKIAS